MTSLKQNWTGNTHSTFATLGASNHSNTEREPVDFYATEPRATQELLRVESFDGWIWESACGLGHMSKELVSGGYDVCSTDLIQRSYGTGGVDFFKHPTPPNIGLLEKKNMNIITNPPYKMAVKFVEHALSCVDDGQKVAMFMKIQFLESQSREQLLLHHPPKRIWASINRYFCAKNGDFQIGKDGKIKRTGSAVFYAWYIWEKGFKGKTEIDFINRTPTKHKEPTLF